MSKNNIEMMRHSCAHLVASAAQALYPKAKFGVGPVVENGFYYDIDFGEPIGEEDLKKIEKKAKELFKKKVKFEKEEMGIDEAIKYFDDNKQEYKVELLKDIKEKGTTKLDPEEAELADNVDNVSLYKTGDFVDLCRGPHVEHTKQVGTFKLTKLAGAYWRGDQNNPQLQRIYGVCFETKDELNEYLHLIAEAEKRDHRKIGKELDLFSFHEEGPGFPFFKPKGTVIWNELTKYWQEVHDRADYGQVRTPAILSKALWEKSGHWDNYRENMYTTEIDEEEYAIKPMNCPGGMLMFKEGMHSYRELPIRWAEIGLDHRHELSGVLAGLFRVRAFWQDDAHIFMTEEQIKDEILGVINLADEIYSKFGLECNLELSTRPKKSIGTDEAWEMATKGLKDALDDSGREYVVNEGDGAFYGPKIDLHIKDALGRTWQCGTVQLDMNLPERFDLTYVDKDNTEKRPIMIHRVIYGSFERFFGILVEHYAGAFPVWLSPVQVHFVPVSEKHLDGARKMAEEFKALGIRVEIDEADETVGNKIRKSAKQKYPYVLVVGDKELAGEDLMIRVRGKEEQESMKRQEFVERVLDEIKTRK